MTERSAGRNSPISASPRLLAFGGTLVALGVLVTMLGQPGATAARSNRVIRPEEVRSILWDASRPWMQAGSAPPDADRPARPADGPPLDLSAPPANAWAMPAILAKYLLVDRQPVAPDHPFYARHFEMIDLRSEDDYAVGHVRHALSAPWGRFERSMANGELSRLERQCIVILYGARHPHEAVVGRFRNAGFRNLYVLEGGLQGWAAQGFEIDKTAAQILKEGEQEFLRRAQESLKKHAARARHPAGEGLAVRTISYEEIPLVSAAALKARLDRKELVDLVYVSDKALFDRKRIPGSRWVPLAKVAEEFRGAPRDRAVVFYCGCCEGKTLGMSGWAVDALRQMGFKDVAHLEGHTKAWELEGYPLEGRQ